MSVDSRTSRNIVYNYVGTIATIATPVLALPFYVSLLGPKQYGLVSFVTTLQVFLGLLESGLSQVSLREFAVRLDKTDAGHDSAATLLFGFERVYWGLAIGFGTLTALFAGIIANHWLVLDPETIAMGRMAVIGAAVIFVGQFPGALYRTVLVGAQAQFRLNVIVVTGTLVRHLGGVLLLMRWPSLLTYLIWQASVVLIETGFRHQAAWHAVERVRRAVRWDATALRPIWPNVTKMSGVVLLGTLTTQLDKIILSKLVPVEQFGYYAIASTVAMGVLNLVYPLAQAVGPGIMKAVNDPVALRAINMRFTQFVSAIVISGTVGYLVLGDFVLRTWLHNPHTVSMVKPLLSVLLIGSCLNAFYHVGYFNWLAANKMQRILLVNSLSIVTCVVLIPVLVARLGMIGATVGFVSMNVIGLIISLEWVVRPRAPQQPVLT